MAAQGTKKKEIYKFFERINQKKFVEKKIDIIFAVAKRESSSVGRA